MGATNHLQMNLNGERKPRGGPKRRKKKERVKERTGEREEKKKNNTHEVLFHSGSEGK